MAVVLFATVAVAYRASPKRDLLDAKYTLLTSEALLTAGSWNLAPYLPKVAAAMAQPGGQRTRWQLRRVGDRILYLYPPGTPLLATAPLALLRLGGATTLDARGRWDERRELRWQKTVAALFGATAVVLAFFLARRELPLPSAAGVALAAAFGTGYWSVVSRGLWSHTGTAVTLSAALLELVRWEDGERPRPALLGALLVAAFWARPTNAFAAVVFTLAVALRYRRALPRLIAVGAAGCALYLVWSHVVWTTWLPRYARAIRPYGKADPLAAFLGQLLSAEHGLLVFSPVLIAVAWVLARRGIAPERRGAAGVSLALVAIYLAFHSWRMRWWGAGAIGPRFLCDLTPCLVWLAAHAWRRARTGARAGAAGGRLRTALVRATVTALALAGVFAHATGALPIRPATLGRQPMDRHGGSIAPLGSAEYWRRLPQPGTARYLVALASRAAAGDTPQRTQRRSRTGRRG